MKTLKKIIPDKLKQKIKNILGIKSFEDLDITNQKYSLENRIARLEALFNYSVIKEIDLVSYYGDLYFWYTKDQSYNWIKPAPLTILNYTPSEQDFLPPEPITISLEDSYEEYDLNKQKIFEMDVKNFLFLHLWLNEVDFTYIDIGANMGTTTVPAAKFFQKYQKENKIISFEPGIVYNLLNQTIKINRISELVTLENIAISNQNRPVIIKSLLEHSESNSIIDIDSSNSPIPLASCNLVEGMRLDEYVQQKGITNDLVVKIDTEGNDSLVIEGMNQLIPSQVAILIFEFTPVLLRSFLPPENILSDLNEKYILLNMLTFTAFPFWKCSLISGEDDIWLKFTQQVQDFPRGWTDVLAIRRDLPNLDKLIAKLTNNGTNNWFSEDC